TYKYDNDSRRIEKSVNGQVTRYFYDGDSINPLYETDGSGTVLRQYVYATTGVRLAMKSKGQTLYYHYNPRGDVVAMTDQNREIVATYEYDSWGNVLKSDAKGIAADNPFGYAGYMYDKEIGMYYLIARYYNPDHGVFLSVDPDPGDEDDPVTQNGYTYAGNNPVMSVDPDGHAFWFVVNAGFAVYDGYGAYKSGKGAKGIAKAAAKGAIGGGKLKVAGKAAKTAVIYLRTNKATGKQYVGRAKDMNRFKERKKEHAKKNNAEYDFQILLRTKPGRQARRYEQKMINKFGGPQKYGGKLENARHEIAKKKWKQYYV
ncbi:RHS repeat-associated core domain-containing protein, partial [Bacillus mobilis]|uniref:RHS repeat domain-containing protein n=1 Tax=Bacillus mobilis TaxID=2026190 RepID=UPI002FDB866E